MFVPGDSSLRKREPVGAASPVTDWPPAGALGTDPEAQRSQPGSRITNGAAPPAARSGGPHSRAGLRTPAERWRAQAPLPGPSPCPEWQRGAEVFPCACACACAASSPLTRPALRACRVPALGPLAHRFDPHRGSAGLPVIPQPSLGTHGSSVWVCPGPFGILVVTR